MHVTRSLVVLLCFGCFYAWSCSPTTSGEPIELPQDGDEVPDPNEEDPGEYDRNLTTDEALIFQELEAGRIDEKKAAYLELLAAFAPSLLPPEYSGDGLLPPGHATLSAAIVLENLDAYGPRERAAIDAMLRPPSDPRFMGFPAEMDQVAFARANPRDACTPKFLESRKEQVGGPSPWVSKTIETKYFTINIVAPGAVSSADAADFESRLAAAMAKSTPPGGRQIPAQPDFASFLDTLYEFYRDTVMLPESDPIKVLSGKWFTNTLSEGQDGKKRIRIELLTCEWHNAAAVALGHLVFPLHAFEDPVLRRAVVPHEIFHLFEYARVPQTETNRDSKWLLEASAMFAEHHLAPEVLRFGGPPRAPAGSDAKFFEHMDRATACPEEPFHSSWSGPCKAPFERQTHLGRGDYSKFVFLEFLRNKRNLVWPMLLRNIWTDYKNSSGDPRPLFTDEEIGLFQAASVVDPKGGPAFFGDGFRQHVELLHYPPSDPDRFTLRVDRTYFAAGNGRITPPVPANGESRNQLQATIAPRATHRWRIELPEDLDAVPLTSEDDTEYFFSLVFQQTPRNAPVRFSWAPLEPAAGQPPVQLADFGAHGAKQNITPVPAQLDWVRAGGSATPAPREMLLVVYNASDADVDYTAGITLTTDCLNANLVQNMADFASQDCASAICAPVADDPDLYAMCKSSMWYTAEFPGQMACHGFGGPLDRPYPSTVVMDGEPQDFSATVNAIYADAGVSSDKWGGLVPLAPLPSYTCDEFTLTTAP